MEPSQLKLLNIVSITQSHLNFDRYTRIYALYFSLSAPGCNGELLMATVELDILETANNVLISEVSTFQE